MTRPRVVIDTDPGVDDAAAILLALADPEIEVVGITAVDGNVALAKTARNALRICELAGVEAPVAAGAPRPLIRAKPWHPDEESVHGDDGLGQVLPAEPRRSLLGVHAVDFIAELAEQGPLTIVGIGPLTNLALVLARHPDITERIERFVIMGGARLEGNVSAAAEFNIWCDPEAAYRVFSSGVPITLLPLDITHQAVLSGPEFAELRATGEIGAALADMIAFYEDQHVVAYGEGFSPMHDVLATLFLSRPDAMTFVRGHVTVDCGDSPSRGATLINTSLDPAVVKNADIGVTLDRECFARTLIESVAALQARRPDVRA
ncbi:MAG TPA: nucleoside hydrolase [Solirubrobacteraceae bacterium]|nr:nucleoside hydrolase [Solirubrobacteraceae bacterium]